MKSARSVTWIAAALVAAGLAAGCDQNSPSQSARNTDRGSGPGMGQKFDQAAADTKQRMGKVGAAAKDSTITAEVKTAIVTEPGLKSTQINVDTSNGVVTLTGSVDSRENAERAVQVAQGIDGVKSVDNRLNVKTSG